MKAKKKIKIDHDLLEVRNVLQSVAQMRKAQLESQAHSKDVDKLWEAKKLEAAVDMRLSTMGIKAI